MKVKVIDYFQDKFTKVYYCPGEEVEIENESRAKDLIGRKLVESLEDKKELNPVETLSLFDKEFDKKAVVAALKAIEVQASGKMGSDTILSKIAELDEEKTNLLKAQLEVE